MGVAFLSLVANVPLCVVADLELLTINLQQMTIESTNDWYKKNP